MARFATLATLNVGDALPDAWVDEVKVLHDWVTQGGSTIASAASIVVTNMYHRISGTTTITTITDSSGPMSGQELFLYFVSAIQIGTSGNIATLTGGNSFYSAGDIGHFVYDSTSAKWVENVGGAPIDANQTGVQGVAGALRTGTGAVGPGATTGVYLDSAGYINISRASNPLTFTQPGDTQYRALFDMNGKILLGDGSNPGDTSIGRGVPGVVTLAGLTGKGNFRNGFGSAAPGLPATITPDAAHFVYRIAPINNSGALTIGAPTNPPSASESGLIFVIIKAPAAGLSTVTWNAAYKGGVTTSFVANQGMIHMFVWDGGTSTWQLCFGITEN